MLFAPSSFAACATCLALICVQCVRKGSGAFGPARNCKKQYRAHVNDLLGCAMVRPGTLVRPCVMSMFRTPSSRLVAARRHDEDEPIMNERRRFISSKGAPFRGAAAGAIGPGASAVAPTDKVPGPCSVVPGRSSRAVTATTPDSPWLALSPARRASRYGMSRQNASGSNLTGAREEATRSCALTW